MMKSVEVQADAQVIPECDSRYRMTGDADLQDYRNFEDFVEYALTHLALQKKNIVRMQVAFDELYTNICYYSGAKRVAVSIGKDADETMYMILEDDGRPYNPLEKPDPDVSGPLTGREEGGLGIYLVKKRVKDITYAYNNGMNQLKVMISDVEEL